MIAKHIQNTKIVQNKVLSIRMKVIVAICVVNLFAFTNNPCPSESEMVTYIVDTKTQHVQLFWKDDGGQIIQNFAKLKHFVTTKKAKLLFATNGGMFDGDYAPHGLFIDNKIKLTELDTAIGQGNFYLKPNGVFYLTEDRVAVVCRTDNFKENASIRYATQSGPMLVIDGQIHSAFRQGSKNLNIRNGVGILPDNKIVFAMSKNPINLYDFASYFKKLGCKNALYLDGFVSRTFWPEGNLHQTDGEFGVMIGVTDIPIK